jgi:glycosyltransferase involved in cell wall biosynthesis
VRIAIVSPLAIFPAYGGSYARLRDLTAHLQDRGHEVDFIYLPARRARPFDKAAHTAAFGPHFHSLTRPPFGDALYLAGRATALARRKLRGPRAPRMDGVDDIYFRPFSAQLAKLHAVRRYEAAIAVYAYTSRALEVFDKGCLRILDTLDSAAHEISEAEECRALTRADAILAIQEDEAATFRRLLGHEAGKVHVVSHMPPARPPVPLARTIGATFAGSSFDANRAALQFFVDRVLPLILERAPDFRLVVAGPIAAEAPAHPAIQRLGPVEYLADAYALAPIALNPVHSGTGLKIKLLDAMALGVPAVSTQFGVRGIPHESLNGVTVVPDGDAPAFASAVLRLFEDGGHRTEMGARAAASTAAWTLAQKAQMDAVLARAGRAR